MSVIIQQKVKALYEAKLEKYRAMGNSHPEVAAQFSVEGILNMYRNDRFIEQLLDEEIEDTIKAA